MNLDSVLFPSGNLRMSVQMNFWEGDIGPKALRNLAVLFCHTRDPRVTKKDQSATLIKPLKVYLLQPGKCSNFDVKVDHKVSNFILLLFSYTARDNYIIHKITNHMPCTNTYCTVAELILLPVWQPAWIYHHSLFCCSDCLTLASQNHAYRDLYVVKMFINNIIPTQTARRGEQQCKEMDYFYFYLPLLLSGSGESEEEDLQIGGRANLILVGCFTKYNRENAYISSLVLLMVGHHNSPCLRLLCLVMAPILNL